ncbi:TraR/DksA family transcriptional regulator [Blastococcus sp. BMG 814]|uniref:TraR/DksA family transcriptional regulator n=1 Tax=Blastococcus carthaginiensis TaxID=3050034 RepID=A0ABT9I9N6_9ACTN|nr:TraR/DksA family transcriptional regulator [Blastococcus carthaginiensis]MDP5181947.1 TraR/DksA family transcriptional regulator [Blastococcus carthaginiensis]
MTTLTTPATTTSPAAATDWTSFRVLLETQRADCVRQHELALAETATSVPDPVAVSRAASLQRRIAEVDAALDRIVAGTYGRCIHCESPIPTERLEFRPFAAACVSCQQAH